VRAAVDPHDQDRSAVLDQEVAVVWECHGYLLSLGLCHAVPVGEQLQSSVTTTFPALTLPVST
jgi:hypothetical protein